MTGVKCWATSVAKNIKTQCQHFIFEPILNTLKVLKDWKKQSYSTIMCTAPTDQCSAICQMWRQDADNTQYSTFGTTHIPHLVLQKTELFLIFLQRCSILLNSAWFEFSLNCQDVFQKIYWNCAICCRFSSSFTIWNFLLFKTNLKAPPDERK